MRLPNSWVEQEPQNSMDVFEAILARRSVRNYSSRKVDGQTINILLEAAVRAPCAFHNETWAFVVVEGKERLRDLSNRAKPFFLAESRRINAQVPEKFTKNCLDPEFNIFYNAELLILICATSRGSLIAGDCWLAAENLMLAACAMGLGSCVIGSALSALNLASIKTQLHIPDAYLVYVPLIVGYSNESLPITARKNPEILAHLGDPA